MAAIGLAEAARLTGKNQSTIHRAMRAGRLSYTKDAAGERRIDPAELERVFGTLSYRTTKSTGDRPGNGASPGKDAASLASNDTQGGELAALQRLLDDREATIRDLRARLDSEVEERRRMLALLTGPRRPWWRRWLR